jgi:acetate---CoA ligase (ADP-forming)
LTEHTHLGETASSRLSSILEASSVAIVGASADPSKITGRPLAYMLARGYQGKLFAVNPAREEVQGLRAYPSLSAIGESIDLAIIGTEAAKVEGIVMEGIAAGVKAFVVFSSGFSETGHEGQALQERLRQLARENDVSILGPNCLGAANSASGLIASFTTALEETPLRRGAFGFISQSGALGAYWLDIVLRSGLGFSHWITTGNECDIDAAEAIEYLVDNPETEVIGVYLEDIRDTLRFRRALQRAAVAGKPVIAMKSGRSSAGAEAAASHTGALAGDDSLYDACLRQFGALRVNSLTELIDTARVFLHHSVPQGTRLAVMSVSGGAGVLIADEADAHGMTLPNFASSTSTELAPLLPSFTKTSNPLDLTGNIVQETSSFGRALTAVDKDPNIDATIVFIGMMHGISATLTESLAKLRQSLKHPLIVVWMSARADSIAALEAARIPVFADIPQAVHALALSVTASRLRESAKVAGIPDVLHSNHQGQSRAMTEWDGKALLRGQNAVSIPAGVLVDPNAKTPELAIAMPVAAKLQSERLLHKSDAGGVILGIRDAERLAESIRTLRSVAAKLEIPLQGVLIEQMVPFDHELILGLRRDPRFGATLTLGRGGVEVELDADVVTRLLPLSADQIEDMLRGLRSSRLFDGFRGRPPMLIKEVATRIAALCDWFARLADVQELEVNPLAARGGEVWCLDALVTRAG